MKKESEIHSNWWRITWDDLTWIAYANSETSSLGCSMAKAEHILYFNISCTEIKFS